MSMFEDIPVDVGIIYEGERIRWPDAYVELGGPRVEHKFELVKVRRPEEIEDGKTIIIGPDIKDLEKKSYPFGIYVEIAGRELEEELEGVIERRIHEYCNYIEGMMHLNQRYDIWIRISKRSVEKGLDSFIYIGKVLQRLFKSELPIIEKIQITFITDPEKVKEKFEEAMRTYEERDARARGLRDEEVDVFYGCTLCQSFAPTHVCVITPQRYSNCGAISWFDGRAAARVDPKGPIFMIEKGKCVDPLKGEFLGVNESVKSKSGGEITKVWLYTAFGYPHTSCGCFEAVAFYIPEVDGIGIVHRGFQGTAPNGLSFSTLADSTAGGRQVDGFHGISIEYMRSPKFLQSDGGWNRIVWLPESLKERVKGFVPDDLLDKIPTDKQVTTIEELKAFLEEKGHPVVKRWEAMIEEKVEEKAEEREAVRPLGVPLEAMISPEGLRLAPGGFRIILKNVKIHAKKLRIKKVEK
ncbi:MAG: CO dehydrogenase/CO-methylating acetyl-CoA synthase complex, beta subunit [Candidatus Bathyarchaeota archaeon B63]|nr:MAG: CO dehydrogenase/CO-methylating acetyl-CoA synthase complex, beta subunit [Candidatus Bathyarchaeota archaeon B63]